MVHFLIIEHVKALVYITFIFIFEVLMLNIVEAEILKGNESRNLTRFEQQRSVVQYRIVTHSEKTIIVNLGHTLLPRSSPNTNKYVCKYPLSS